MLLACASFSETQVPDSTLRTNHGTHFGSPSRPARKLAEGPGPGSYDTVTAASRLVRSPSATIGKGQRTVGSDVVPTPGPYVVEGAAKAVSSQRREPAYSFPAAKRF